MLGDSGGTETFVGPYRADGVHLEMDFHNEREVEQAMRIIEEYTGSSLSVSADVHTNQPVGEQDNAQESIRIREEKSQEEDRLKPLYDAIVAGNWNWLLKLQRMPLLPGYSRRILSMVI